MLGGRNLVGRALDQRGKTFAGEPMDFDSKAIGLHVELCQSAMLLAAASKSPSRQRDAP
jgi:hypothetical protein